MNKSVAYMLALVILFIYTGLGAKVFIFIRVADAVMLFLMLFWLANAYKYRHFSIQYSAFSNSLTVFYLLLSFYILGSAYFMNSPAVAVKEAIQRIEMLIFFLLLSRFLENSETREQFLRATFYCLLLLAIYTMVVHMSMGIVSGYKKLNEPKYSFGMVALISFYYATNKLTKSTWNYVMLFFCLGMLVLSGERQGWVALAIALYVTSFSFMKVFTWIVKHPGKVLSMIAAGIILFVGIMQIEYINNQVYSFVNLFSIFFGSEIDYTLGETRSNQARLFLYITGIGIFMEHPVFGLGTENFKAYLDTLEVDSWLIHGIHSEYLRMLVENGLVGIILFLAMLFTGWRKLQRIKGIRMWSYRNQLYYDLTKGIFVYGSVANLFLGGGVLNILYYLLPFGLILSLEREYQLTSVENKTENEQT